MRTQIWTMPVRAVLALMWIVHGLEKFGVRWPHPIAGGTGSVSGMLGFMVDETPLSFLRQGIEGFLLPWARQLQYPVAVTELAIGLAIATGVLLPWAALGGALLQSFIWLGFISVVWPLQYPLVILLHVALLASVVRRQTLPRMPKVARTAVVLSPLVLGLLIMAYRAEWFGSWPWNYYLLGGGYASLLLVGRRAETAQSDAAAAIKRQA